MDKNSKNKWQVRAAALVPQIEGAEQLCLVKTVRRGSEAAAHGRFGRTRRGEAAVARQGEGCRGSQGAVEMEMQLRLRERVDPLPIQRGVHGARYLA